MATLRIKEADTDNTVFEEVIESTSIFTEETVNREVADIDRQIADLTERKTVLTKKLSDAKKL